MSKTTQEIYNDMKVCYEMNSTEKLQEGSAYAKLMEAFAAELYALYCYGEYVKNQSFVQTAEGEYLDKLAELRGLERKKAEKASGEIVFFLNDVAETDINFDKGIICSVRERPYLQFVTTEDGVISAGSRYACAKAEAISEGAEYNVAKYEISVMVNAPAGIARAYNSKPFTGGYDTEDDESLRWRLKNFLIYHPNGVSPQFLENIVLNLDFVSDCHIARASEFGKLIVYVSTKAGGITDEQKEEITEALSVSELFISTVEIYEAENKLIDIFYKIGKSANADMEAMREKLAKIASGTSQITRIGKPFYIDDLMPKVLEVEGVVEAKISSLFDRNGIVYCDSSQKIVCAGTRMDFYDA